MFLFSKLWHARWLIYCRRFWRQHQKQCLILSGFIVLAFSVTLIIRANKIELIYQPQNTEITLPALTTTPTVHHIAHWRDEVVQPGDTVALMLAKFNIADADINHLLNTKVINIQKQQLMINQVFSIRQQLNGQLTDIQFFNDNDNGEKNLVSLIQQNGQWQLSMANIDTEVLPTFKAVVIKTSAQGALAQADIPVAIRAALRQIFAEQIQLDDLIAGDTIRLIYQNLYYHGQLINTGDILAAEISHQNGLYQAYFFDEEHEGNGQYYDPEGQPLRHAFSRLPVNGARISSPFGTRVHPILHTILMHSGIDYAVPTGTPIYATADGIVESIGVRGGYGNAIVLRHNDSVTTLYGHMSAFAPISIGQPINAGEIIGYVGMTGRATGPHVHYEVRINGQPVNPASMALPAKPLNQRQWPSFSRQQQHWDKLLSPVRDLKVTIAHLD